MIFVSLAYVLVASAQQLPASTWNQSLFLLPHYNSPLAMAPPKDLAAYQMTGNEKEVSNYDNHTITVYQTHWDLISSCCQHASAN
jgi:hypothetical protein